MPSSQSVISLVDLRVERIFAFVTEALAGATHALLAGDFEAGSAIVAGDSAIDDLTTELEQLIWDHVDHETISSSDMRHLVSILLILPELERSADLAEHIAQRAVSHLGTAMTPICRGLIQQMSDITLAMWRLAAEAYADRSHQALVLDDLDENVDSLRDRLNAEIENGEIPAPIAGQVALLARFYERLGDHAVNLARRIATISPDWQ